jgi:RNA-directed DNA polymerase
VNTGAPWPTLKEAEARVRGIQAKLHRWATQDRTRRFDDLFNLVGDPAFLLVGWRRVRGNKGARSAGVDGETAYYVESVRGEEVFLAELRASLKDRSFRPLPVRERLIPKPGSSKWRRLGIATVRDRVVQAALKLVLEPIWEADFQPCSYGFRPGRRAQDAIAEIHHLASHSYEWVLDGDITACFDELSHSAMLERVRERITDRRVLALVKAFLTAGILTEDGAVRDTVTGTPQGGILSPLLSNLALSVLDEHIIEHGQASAPSWVRERRRRQGQPNYRIVRYADDFVVLVAGTRDDTAAVREQVTAVLATIGLRLSPEKTTIAHIDEGFEFLGRRIQRHQQRGSQRRYVYTYPLAEGAGRREGQGAGDHRADHQPAVGRRAAPAQLGAARLGQLLPPRGVSQDVRVSGRLQLASSDALAVPQAPAHQLTAYLSPLDAGLAAHRGEGHAV